MGQRHPGAGSPFRSLLRDALKAGRKPREAIASRRAERLAALAAFARERSAFYRSIYGNLRADAALEELPPVAKHDLMARFDEWTTDPEVTRDQVGAFIADPSRIGRLFLDRYLVFATSGTTGRPAVFLHDRGAAAVSLALFAARRLPGLAPGVDAGRFLAGGGRTATIIVTGGHFTSSVIDALARARLGRLSRLNRTFSLMTPLPELVAALDAFRPAVVGSYPTVLSVLAEERQAGRLRIRPALVLTGAERLTLEARRRIAAAFGCPVRDTYAASEFMGIAFDCRFGRLHVNADWLILEPVDAAFRPVPPGTPSHTTLLTNLANRVQPLIRYDLGDSVTELPDPCPCGSPLPAVRVAGRRDEILYVESESGAREPLLPMVLATIIEEAAGVRSYQVIQRGPARLCLRVEEVPGYSRSAVCDEVVRRLVHHLAARGLSWVAVEMTDERPRREPAGGKLRQVFAEPCPDP